MATNAPTGKPATAGEHIPASGSPMLTSMSRQTLCVSTGGVSPVDGYKEIPDALCSISGTDDDCRSGHGNWRTSCRSQ